MEDLLNCNDLYDLIEGNNAKSSDMLDANSKKLNKKTLGVIRQWVNISLYNHVAKKTEPHTIEPTPQSLEELRKHVRANDCTSKDFIDAKANEFEAQGRSVNC